MNDYIQVMRRRDRRKVMSVLIWFFVAFCVAAPVLIALASR